MRRGWVCGKISSSLIHGTLRGKNVCHTREPMNPSAVLKTLLKPFSALTALAGAMLMSSCYAPGPATPPGPAFSGPTKYGYRGTDSPNYPTAPVTKPNDVPKIVRDPNNTNIDITPPDPRTPTTNPNATLPSPTNPPPLTNPSPPTNPEPTKPPPAVKEDLPYGIPVVGKKGMVYSPYAPEKGQVDVDGFKRGTRVE